jgi:hypothetical protein
MELDTEVPQLPPVIGDSAQLRALAKPDAPDENTLAVLACLLTSVAITATPIIASKTETTEVVRSDFI